MSKANPTFFDDVNEFLDAADAPKASLLDCNSPNIPRIEFCRGHVVEEWENETKEALARYLQNPSLENLVEVADGIGDSIYVLCQLARSLGIPLNSVWNCIQASNMGKVNQKTGKIERHPETGKVLKPEGWKPPDLFALLLNEQNRQAKTEGMFGAENWQQ